MILMVVDPSPEAPVGEWDDVLPLRRGASGPAVTDLQLRLVRLGYSTSDDVTGDYGAGTEFAVHGFQTDRGLRVDGICGQQTWSCVVEAGFRLGDRVLYRWSPMLHGDDVAALQRQLSELGFDPAGVDGIFGDLTMRALRDFQRNAGLDDDGICGPRTLSELGRLTTRHGGEDLVTSVRERLAAASRSATLAGKQIAVGEFGGFSNVVRAVGRALATDGAVTIALHHPDESEQASAANAAGVDCYVGFRLDPSHSAVRTNFYRGYRYESQTSRRLAEMLLSDLVKDLELDDGGAEGMALPILRETQMPAVIVELGAPAFVAMRTTEIAAAVVRSLDQWMTFDWESV
jgi:N-acetylmuramoyl-L-alanine amidase